MQLQGLDRDPLAVERPHHLGQRGDVADVDRRHHVQPGGQQVLDVLPPGGTLGAGRVLVDWPPLHALWEPRLGAAIVVPAGVAAVVLATRRWQDRVRWPWLLVLAVVFIFLQSWRATLIPMIAVPISLFGSFAGLWLFGFSINMLTLFAMVLAIGIVVDDAIVVVENVERIMAEEGLPPKEATRKAMSQITSAIIGITLVLMAVFMPSALQSGSVGAIYRQFALTIALSTAFSAFLALAFTPALCATLIRATHQDHKNRFFVWFNKTFDWTRHTYTGHVRSAVRHAPRWMAAFAVVIVVCGLLFWKLPSSFVPDEDQGYALAIVSLPAGATIAPTLVPEPA